MTELEFISRPIVRLVEAAATDDSVAHAAWVSNFGGEHQKRPHNGSWNQPAIDEWEKKVGGLINFLYRERHMSPFEHGHLKFFVEAPITVAREFMRHRTFSYNEMSGRYKELPPRFFLPDSDRPVVQSGKIGSYTFTPGTDEQYGTVFSETVSSYGRSWSAYQTMLEAGIAKEVARNVLPVGIMTQFYVTGNPRNWMQFLTLRNDPNAMQEIRQVANDIEQKFALAMPHTYAAYKKHDYRDEKAELELLRKKVQQLESELSYAKPYRNGYESVR